MRFLTMEPHGLATLGAGNEVSESLSMCSQVEEVVVPFRAVAGIAAIPAALKARAMFYFLSDSWWPGGLVDLLPARFACAPRKRVS